MNRKNSQKPTDELYADFRQSFPDLRPPQTTKAEQQATAVATPAMTETMLDPHHAHIALGLGHDEIKDHDHDMKGLHEQWRYTPSMMDPDSFAFSSFANQPPGYYTPTPGGVGVGTPLSLPTSGSGFATGQSAMNLSSFNHHEMPHDHFQSYDPFGDQRSFPPSDFSLQATSYKHDDVDADGELSPTDDFNPSASLARQDSDMKLPAAHLGSMQAPPLPSLEKFRFSVTLNAPTAMVRNRDEIPITYLNKGQAYSISISDTVPPKSLSKASPVRYRTFIRVSFEDEQQRQRPYACWQLWKEGRGTNEAHQRGGKLQAVEYVEPTQEPGSIQAPMKVLTASFDGFSVEWSPGPETGNDCSISVRFNFLSTDFSHSKGVKGIPVRLCAKTEIVPANPTDENLSGEVCFCKVKLFRDHGAERKLANDIAHVKKTMDKLRQQLASAEAGLKDSNKRKRSGSTVVNPRAGKILKHKRTWSTSGVNDAEAKSPVEDDLHGKLAVMQDMFTSTRPASVLYLRGEDRDDPDKFPVHLTGEFLEIAKRSISRENSWGGRESADGYDARSGSLIPTSPSSGSYHTSAMTASLFQPSTMKQSPVTTQQDWAGLPAVTSDDVESIQIQNIGASLDHITKIPKVGLNTSATMDSWIEAIGVDPSYQPPIDRPIKPIACFYARHKTADEGTQERLYRAIYIMQPTIKEFVNVLCSKMGVEPTRVLRTTHTTQTGLNVLVDDDVIRELPEGQDMTVEFFETVVRPSSAKPEVIVDAVDPRSDAGTSAVHDASPVGFELRLTY